VTANIDTRFVHIQPTPEKKGLFERGRNAPIRCVAWDPKSKLIATAGNDKKLRIWDVKKNNEGPSEALVLAPWKDFAHTHMIFGLAWSPSGKEIAVVDDSLSVWKVANGTNRFCQQHHKGNVYAVDWSPDGKFIATAGHDLTLRICDARNGKPLKVFQHDQPVYCVKWSPGGRKIVCGDGDSVVIWDVQAEFRHSGLPNKNLASLSAPGHGGPVFSVDWSPDGCQILSGGKDGHAVVWDAESLGMGHKVKRTHPVFNVSWSPTGNSFLTADDSVVVWDATSGKVNYIFEDHARPESEWTSAAWSDDCRDIASVGYDGSIRVSKSV